jgi:hypothetical protein
MFAAENNGKSILVQQCSGSLMDGSGNLLGRIKPFNSQFGKDAFAKNLTVGFDVIKFKITGSV